MRFDITVNIRAVRDDVWQFLTDTKAMSGCVAGLESVVEVEPARRFLAMLALPIGQTHLTCAAELEWLQQIAPSRAAIQVRVMVGQAGSAQPFAHQILAHNTLRLVNGVPGFTQMQWRMVVDLLGNYAGIPPQFIHPLIQKQSHAFFTCLKHRIENATPRLSNCFPPGQIPHLHLYYWKLVRPLTRCR